MLDLSKYTKELSNQLSASSNILLICHINPDGDAVGSQLALYQYLISKGKNVEMLSPNYLQEFLKWMDGVEKINIFIRDRKAGKEMVRKADLIIMLDFNQSNRLGEIEDEVLKSAATKIVIDHHLNYKPFADLLISDTSKCSTTELLHLIITELNGGIFRNKHYAESIYVGIVTDTGNFEHGSFTSETFRIISGLLEEGIDKDKVFNQVFNNFTADRMRLQGYAINERMVVIPEKRTAYITLTKKELEKYNYRKGDSEGFVNLPLSIKGIDFSVFIVEKEGFVKLSFRSRGSFAVNEFAEKYFNGGGHRNAAGGERYDTLDNTLKYFLEVLEKETVNLSNVT
jgi:bifunctional oligoribonuclease and PAP phosphatase NrnA